MKIAVIDGVKCQVIEECQGLDGDRVVYFRPLSSPKKTAVINGVECEVKSYVINYDGKHAIYYRHLSKPKQTMAEELKADEELVRKWDAYAAVFEEIEKRLQALEGINENVHDR